MRIPGCPWQSRRLQGGNSSYRYEGFLFRQIFPYANARCNPLGAKVRRLSMASGISCSLKDSNLVDKYVDGSNPLKDICTSEVTAEIQLSERSGSDVPGNTESQPTALSPQQVSKLNVKGVETPGESSSSSARKPGPSEFELLKVIGMGAFGKVLQASSL